HDAHRERYGYARPDRAVEAVTLRVVVRAPAPPLPAPALEEAAAPPPAERARVVLGGRALEALRVRRADLRAGHRLEGPAVVLEYSATAWVPPGWRLEVDRWGCLHLAPEGGAG
ncbi:MAG TPA: hypothetical protein VFQ22_02275, partial [Longimicrobiales bacterium]|nr:hypothetical protein [Longimicrobiales bacterium]